jgi:hypothetical protein
MAKVFGEWTKHILKIVMDDVNICGESWEEGDVWIEKHHKHILKDNMAKKFGEWTKHALKIFMDDVNICSESWEKHSIHLQISIIAPKKNKSKT